MRVLVAYASHKGGTAEIARVLAEELRTPGVEVDLLPASSVRTIEPYRAVLLGSAIYYFRWSGEALRFASRFEAGLRERAVWLFDSGPLDASADEGHPPPAKGIDGLATRLGARAHVTFGGRLLPETAGFFTRKIMEGGKAGTYGDYRNLERARRWALELRLEILPMSRHVAPAPQVA